MNLSKENPISLQFQEVYVSDMLSLKYFFNGLNGLAKDAPVNATFGIPFLQAKCGNEIIAFACLTNENKLLVHQKSFSSPSNENEWKVTAEQMFHQQSDTLCKEELENSIIRLTSWLNNVCN